MPADFGVFTGGDSVCPVVRVEITSSGGFGPQAISPSDNPIAITAEAAFFSFFLDSTFSLKKFSDLWLKYGYVFFIKQLECPAHKAARLLEPTVAASNKNRIIQSVFLKAAQTK
jgi:hypothetical protein